MEWFLLAAPVPGPIEFDFAGVLSVLAGLLATVTPVFLAIRHAFGLTNARAKMPELRVIDGGRELTRHSV